MRGLDISSSKYLDMSYFIDSLQTDHEAFLLYCRRRLLELGFDPESIYDPGFSAAASYDPALVENFVSKIKNEKLTIENIKLLKEYYLNLLSISEFVLYNSVEKKTPDIDIEGKNEQKLKIQELERSKISSDLHDSSIQILTGLVHKVELMQRLIDFDIPRVKTELSSVIDDLKRSISDLRNLIFNLRAPSFLDFSLKETIEDYCNYKNVNRKFNVIVTASGEEGDLYPVIKSNLYRIAQEAFNNILSHSEGDSAFIRLEYAQDRVLLSVKDNGVGVDESILSGQSLGKKHFGLLIMRERAQILGGSFDIISSKTEGMEIRVSVPRIPEGN